MVKKIRSIMGMPVTVQITQSTNNPINQSTERDMEKVFDYFRKVDAKYSPFKITSEVGKLNRGEEVENEMLEILKMAKETKKETNGYFDIKRPDGKIDPSGIVKGWAIKHAADILRQAGYKKFFVDAGGDAEIVGTFKWGIRNPFNVKEIVKVLKLSDCGIATSGTYERGQHIWNPITGENKITEIISLTVIGPDVYEADRFATPAFVMGREGIKFIEGLKGFEGYMIDKDGMATMTIGFEKYML